MSYVTNATSITGTQEFRISADAAPAIKQNLQAIAYNMSTGVGRTSDIAGNANYQAFGGDGAAGPAGAGSFETAAALVMLNMAGKYDTFEEMSSADTLLSQLSVNAGRW